MALLGLTSATPLNLIFCHIRLFRDHMWHLSRHLRIRSTNRYYRSWVSYGGVLIFPQDLPVLMLGLAGLLTQTFRIQVIRNQSYYEWSRLPVGTPSNVRMNPPVWL